MAGYLTDEDNDALYSEVGNYFLKNEKLYDVHFIAGEKKERIGVVKALLINQSRIWWTMLSPDSQLAETKDIVVPDIEPEIFILLLKHCYGGLNDCNDLLEDTKVQLCYCANKYQMATLMKKLAAGLKPSKVNQVFAAIYCLVNYNLHGVEEAVKEIIQTKTEQVLEHSRFLEFDEESVTYICRQDKLFCTEMELWNAVVVWAKHQAGKEEEGPGLRDWMLSPLQHIRLLSMSKSDLADHVFSTEILNVKEIVCICRADVTGIQTLSKKSCIRGISHAGQTVVLTCKKEMSRRPSLGNTSSSSIVTKNRRICLLSFACKSAVSNGYTERKVLDSKSSTNVTVQISQVTNYLINSSEHVRFVIKLDNLEYYEGEWLSIPTILNGKGIILEAKSKYNIKLTFSRDFNSVLQTPCVLGHDFEHGTFYCSSTYKENVGCTLCHIFKFTYSV